ncbi:hypothetical protein ACFXDH_50070 [Streptomyces sp. NPDC059467]|uniref:hypothetical protein n=1 Tax=Streptomyces sp. NPDC059467 TaxID=3346844 RepID=UPI0036BBD750
MTAALKRSLRPAAHAAMNPPWLQPPTQPVRVGRTIAAEAGPRYRRPAAGTLTNRVHDVRR